MGHVPLDALPDISDVQVIIHTNLVFDDVGWFTYPGYKDDRLLSSDVRTAPKERDPASPQKNDATI
jgi:hypothetical protein